MSEDLQSLLEKINREGVEKANAESAKIIAAAKAEAADIVKAAKAEADQAKADAEKAAADYAERAKVTIKEGARDTVRGLQNTITAMLEKLLVKDVNAALADPAACAKLLQVAIGDLLDKGELAVVTSKRIADTLKSQFAAQKEVTISADDGITAGFTVKLDGGRVEHSFTDKVVAEELAKHLRADLAALV